MSGTILHADAHVCRAENHYHFPGSCSKQPDVDRSKSPSLAEMEAMAHEIFERLPKGFRTLCEGVIIRVDDFPTDEVLDEMQAESEFDLLGLFQGVGLPHQSNDDIARLPNMVWLYRRPILDYWAEHEETLGHIVRHVLIHEIGHHFGLSDDDMEAIEARRRLGLREFALYAGAIFAINHRPFPTISTGKCDRWTSSPRWKASRRP